MHKTLHNISDGPQARNLRELRNKLYPSPLVGVHFGLGRHVDMPTTWDQAGVIPAGWTGIAGELDLGDDWALGFPAGFDVVLDANESGVLSALEKALLLSKYVAAANNSHAQG